MTKINELKELTDINEAKKIFGAAGGFNYAVFIEGLDDMEYFKKPLGRQMEDQKKVKTFKDSAKKGYVGAKGKATMPAVRKWVKENSPSEFFAKWREDSDNYSEDTVDIYYK